MSILFVSKTTPWCQAAERFIRASGLPITVAHGERHDPLPDVVREWSGDYVISFLCAWVLPEAVLTRARIAAINFHPGPPEHPGIGCYNFAIYQERKEYGVTCHHMASRVDTGRIIDVLRFPMLPQDSVGLLKDRSMAALLTLYYQVIGRLLTGQPLPESQETWQRQPYTRRELDALCRVTPDMPPEEVARRVRATYYPGYPGPYLESGGQRHPLQPDGRIEA
ncbi:MAG: formyltransferase family protein [Chthoniobacter sp.]|uniref:formyltransferase family protein n=1 Tax=Chthoniobacter sp. TaxID=2510640 RepID=UPI0032AC9897